MRGADVIVARAFLQAQHLERFGTRHARPAPFVPGLFPLLLGRTPIGAKGAIKIGFQKTTGLLVVCCGLAIERDDCVLSELVQALAGISALQDRAVHVAAVMVEFHFQPLRSNTGRLARRRARATWKMIGGPTAGPDMTAREKTPCRARNEDSGTDTVESDESDRGQEKCTRADIAQRLDQSLRISSD